MSISAKHLKYGQYIFDDSDNQVYQIVDKKEHKTDIHTEHFTVYNCSSNHQTTKIYGSEHHIRLVEPTIKHYTLSHLLDHIAPPDRSYMFGFS